jgi:hypothetical protein
MQHFFYKAIPTVKQFQSDSSVTFAVRGEDKILKHLDWLLERYHLHSRKLNADLQRIILCEIFLGANYWIKAYHEKKPAMKKERYPAVLALFEAAVGQLSTLLRCSRPMVAIQIEEIFGRELMPEGAKTDGEAKTKPEYFTAMQLELYRMRFRAGRAYHAGLDATRPMHLTPLDTAPFFFEILRTGTDGKQATMNKGWGPFVMTMEREFYMTKHWFDTPGHKNIFHSSYTHGRAISAAGTMYAEHGIIKGIRPDSGHYKPLEHNIVSALLALQMFAVRMDEIEVQDYAGERLGTAREFVSSRLSWSQFQAAGHLQKMRKAGALGVHVPASNLDGPSGNTALLALMNPPASASGPRPGYAQTPNPGASKPAYSQTP